MSKYRIVERECRHFNFKSGEITTKKEYVIQEKSCFRWVDACENYYAPYLTYLLSRGIMDKFDTIEEAKKMLPFFDGSMFKNMERDKVVCPPKKEKPCKVIRARTYYALFFTFLVVAFSGNVVAQYYCPDAITAILFLAVSVVGWSSAIILQVRLFTGTVEIEKINKQS
jgi:hypothetical protein